jgi:hypothetical protein
MQRSPQSSHRVMGALAIDLSVMAQPFTVATSQAQQPKPNNLFILTDNLG